MLLVRCCCIIAKASFNAFILELFKLILKETELLEPGHLLLCLHESFIRVDVLLCLVDHSE